MASVLYHTRRDWRELCTSRNCPEGLPSWRTLPCRCRTCKMLEDFAEGGPVEDGPCRKDMARMEEWTKRAFQRVGSPLFPLNDKMSLFFGMYRPAEGLTKFVEMVEDMLRQASEDPEFEVKLARQRKEEVAKRAALMEEWKNCKFEPLSMEKAFQESVWPQERDEYERGPMVAASRLYAEEQRKLLESYDSVKKNIKTDEDYDYAEERYQAVLEHVKAHGKLLMKVPVPEKREHKKPVEESVAPTHVGRRAARAARNASEKSTVVLKSRLSAVQPYQVGDE